jgi:hypothetical protein
LIESSVELQVPLIDLRDVPFATREAKTQQLAARRSATTFRSEARAFTSRRPFTTR